MATAKIATLAIRTLAKPIATQLKTQAASHERFRKVCIAIAQTLHRSEMALRYNLLPKAPREPSASGEEAQPQPRPKVRPLNEAKAIANGANFLSEAFLFLIAATLIIGENYRSSAKNKRQRNRTEEKVEEVADALNKLCARLDVDPRAIGLDVAEHNEDEESPDKPDLDGQADLEEEASRHAAAVQHRRQKDEDELKRLRSAVDVLLRMAISSGWIQGADALDLKAILDGKDGEASRGGQGANDSGTSGASSSSPILAQVALAQSKKAEASSQASSSTSEGTPSAVAASKIAAASMFEGWLGGAAKPPAAPATTAQTPVQQPTQEAQTKADSDWEAHPETKDERIKRERCEEWSDQLFRTSKCRHGALAAGQAHKTVIADVCPCPLPLIPPPTGPMIRFMARHLAVVSCDPQGASQSSEPRLVFESCPPNLSGGFSPSEPGKPASESGILICANRIMDKQHLEDTLAHEMIHWWDHCRFKVDWSNLRQHACSEVSRDCGLCVIFASNGCSPVSPLSAGSQIRAASLSGDCNIGREWQRRNFAFTKQHQACARRRAVLSVAANPKCADKAEAERVVDEVWSSCFADTRPFDEVGSRDVQAAMVRLLTYTFHASCSALSNRFISGTINPESVLEHHHFPNSISPAVHVCASRGTA